MTTDPEPDRTRWSFATNIPDKRLLRKMYTETLRVTYRTARAKWVTIVSTSYIVPILEVGAIFMIYALIDTAARAQATAIFGKIFGTVNLPAPEAQTVTVLLFIAAFSMIAASVSSRYVNQVLLGRLRIQMYVAHCHRLIDAFLHTNIRRARDVGKDRVINSVFNDCGSVQSSVELGIASIGAVWAIGLCLVAAAALSWKLLLAGVVLYALPILASRHIFVWMRALGEERVRSQERALGHLNDVLQGFERTKTDGLENLLSRDSNEMLHSTQQWKIDKRIAEAKQLAILDGLSMIGILIVLFFGISVFDLELSLMLALFLIFGRLRGHVTILTRSALELRALISPISRYFELVSAFDYAPFSAAGNRPDPSSLVPIELSNVNFRYGEIPVLRDINLSADRADRILITGASGQGKSTLIEVLCGLLPPDSGAISVAGQPFDEEAFYRLRSAITLVTPSVYLFRGSLRDNLTLGRTVSDADITEALEHARLNEVVESLDGGLDGDIGVNGSSLSLGQRQRALLCRVFLDRPKLLLLDEATANLNPDLEVDIIDRLQSFLDPDCVVIMVAHKAPANFNFNKRYEMREGRLIEIDVPAALTAIPGP